jgi:hypothetical protein
VKLVGNKYIFHKAITFPVVVKIFDLPVTRANLYAYIINGLDDASNLCGFMQKVLFRVGKLFPPSRAIIPKQERRLETCKLFKECGSYGLVFLLRETAWVSSYCLCKYTYISRRNTEISFDSSSGQKYSIVVTFINRYILKLVVTSYVPLLSAPLPQTQICHLISARDYTILHGCVVQNSM